MPRTSVRSERSVDNQPRCARTSPATSTIPVSRIANPSSSHEVPGFHPPIKNIESGKEIKLRLRGRIFQSVSEADRLLMRRLQREAPRVPKREPNGRGCSRRNRKKSGGHDCATWCIHQKLNANRSRSGLEAVDVALILVVALTLVPHRAYAKGGRGGGGKDTAQLARDCDAHCRHHHKCRIISLSEFFGKAADARRRMSAGPAQSDKVQREHFL
jgi:hypothetical protein